MDLGVARCRAVGRGEDRHVARPRLPRLRDAREDRERELPRRLAQKRLGRPARRLRDPVGLHREARAEHLGQQREPRALSGRLLERRRARRWFSWTSSQARSIWTRATRTASPVARPPPRGSPASCRTRSARTTFRARRGRRTPTAGSRPRRSSRSGAARRRRRRRSRTDGSRRRRSTFPGGGVTPNPMRESSRTR